MWQPISWDIPDNDTRPCWLVPTIALIRYSFVPCHQHGRFVTWLQVKNIGRVFFQYLNSLVIMVQLYRLISPCKSSCTNILPNRAILSLLTHMVVNPHVSYTNLFLMDLKPNHKLIVHETWLNTTKTEAIGSKGNKQLGLFSLSSVWWYKPDY